MKQFVFWIYLLLSPLALAQPSELFISEYVEGSGNSKAVEIFNGTGASISLSGYVIEVYSNGSSTPSTITLTTTATIANGATYVLAHSGSAAGLLSLANQTSGSLTFNGNDAVVLKKSGTVIDVIGQVGFDPGTQWSASGISTLNNTMRRKATIGCGDADGSNAFDPSIQWDGFAIDTFSGIGAHTTTFTGSCSGSVFANGSGTASLTNATASNPLLNTDIFRRTLEYDVQIPIVGVSTGTITRTNVIVPSDWTGLLIGNVTLSGAGCTSASVALSGNTIEITGAAITAANTCTVLIADLTAPTPTNANDGVYTFDVQTAGATGLLTSIASSPKAYVTIPIEFLHDNDASGVALDLGNTVAVEGTVLNATGTYAAGRLESSIDDGTGGMMLFSSSLTSVLSIGDVYVAKGAITQFQGFTELTPPSSANLINLSSPATVTPISATILAVNTSPETYESRLVTFTGVTFDCTAWVSGANASFTLTQGSDTFTMLIDVDTGILGNTCPASPLDVTGIIAQSDAASPFDSFYQIRPRFIADLGGSGGGGGGGCVSTVEFSSMYSVNKETSTTTVTVKVVVKSTNPSDPFSVDLTAGASSTATNGTDLTGVTLPQTLNFTAGSTTPQTLTFTMVNDGNNTEGIENLVLQLANPVNTCIDTTSPFGSNQSKHTIWIMDNDAPTAQIFPTQCGSTLLASLLATYGGGSNEGMEYDAVPTGSARDTLYAVMHYDGTKTCGLYENQCISYSFNRTTGSPDPSTTVFTGGSGINAEHIWPQSLGADAEPARSDLHNLWPTNAAANSTRSNHPFGDLSNAVVDLWYNANGTSTVTSQSSIPADPINWSGYDAGTTTFEPRDFGKGIVARGVAYFRMTYTGDNTFWGQVDDIAQTWNTAFPVSAFEAQRNVLIASYQNNKLNPFILDPSLLTRAYFVAAGDAAACAAALPVEFATVFAKIENKNAILSWTTAGESNNDRFEIQEKVDNVWKTVATVKGAGTSIASNTYSATLPNLASGYHTFRIKQVDYDGSVLYSDEVRALIELEAAFQLSEAYPNPFNPTTSFSLTVAQDQKVKVEVYDLTGRLVQTLFNGNILANEIQYFHFDASHLASGTYLYRVLGEKFTQTKRIQLLK